MCYLEITVSLQPFSTQRKRCLSMMLLNEVLRLVTVSNALLPWRSVLAVFAELTPK